MSSGCHPELVLNEVKDLRRICFSRRSVIEGEILHFVQNDKFWYRGFIFIPTTEGRFFQIKRIKCFIPDCKGRKTFVPTEKRDLVLYFSLPLSFDSLPSTSLCYAQDRLTREGNKGIPVPQNRSS